MVSEYYYFIYYNIMFETAIFTYYWLTLCIKMIMIIIVIIIINTTMRVRVCCLFTLYTLNNTRAKGMI